jgi:hypothetical protein
MKTSLDAAYSGGVLDVNIRAGLTKRQVLENSNIKTIVYGGASAGLGQIETGYQGFIEVVHASIQLGTASPGVPLIYRFRRLCDNNLANVTLTSQYSLIRQIRLRQALRIVATKCVCDATGDECGLDDSNPDIDRLVVRANVTQRTSPTDPGVTYCLHDTTIYDAAGHEMTLYDEHAMGTSVLMELDAENFDYSLATMKIYAYAHDDDTWPCDDDGVEAYITVPAGQFLDGSHNVVLDLPGGARLHCEVTVEAANAPPMRSTVRRAASRVAMHRR